MLRKLAALVAVIAGGLWLAFPALAQTNPVSSAVSGTVTIPATLTMSLSANSFTLSPNPGDVVNTGISPFAISATISTNDPTGYTLSEALSSQFTDTTNDRISASGIQPYMYSSPTNGAFGGNTGTGLQNGSVNIAQTNTVSAPSGDQWGLAWQFNIPGNQAAGTYNGTIMVTAVGN
jgi:hypothetical protein